ncbi:MAG: gamma-glutamyl-gamma-aminobutyrate hydrolase family protein [Gammaproteobacteria bacterium]|nr:gamma-glutamyl-gamma-aminobutyrate hydrolase family protein [Gammaproteobacteria bacterium]
MTEAHGYTIFFGNILQNHSLTMKRLLVFQHVPHEILGTFNPLLKDAGFRIRYVNFGRTPDEQPNVDKYDGLIVLGGPMCVDQSEKYPHLETEIGAIGTAIEHGKPVFGICLGAQLIATALGARVYRNPVKEIGWYDVTPTPDGERDPLFSSFDGTQKIFQWHGDTFDIPADAVHLATSPDCTNQAFRYGDRTYGLQFHLEVDGPLVQRWLKTPVHTKELDALDDDRMNAARILADTPRYIDKTTDLGNRLFGEFIRLFSSRVRRVTLPSR